MSVFVFNGATFISDMFNHIQGLLDGYSQKAFASLRSALAVPLAAAIVLYYTIMGISIMYGWVELSMRNIIKSALKASLIYTFAMNWDFFLEHFINLITSTMTIVSNATMNIDNSSLQSPKSIGDNVQQALNNVWALTEYYWKNASWHAPIKLLYGSVELILGCLVLVPACGYLLVSQGLLALLFGMAPLCISFMLFKPTQPFFNRWMGEITGQAMSVMFVSAALGMVLTMLSWAFPSDVKDINPASILATIFVCLISFAILKQAAGLGRSIGEGFAVFCQYTAVSQATDTGKALISGAATAAKASGGAVGKGIEAMAGGLSKGVGAVGNVLTKWRNRDMG